MAKDTQVDDGRSPELAAVYAEIVGRNPEHDFEPTLGRVERVCELLGDPQRAFRTIHLTGTNGKTSTARMIESLVREQGLRTGRFTSPHLTSITERIAIDGEPVTEQRFVEIFRDVEPYVRMVDDESVAAGGPRLSFFEVLTVMAFAAFADAPVDVAIIEVGLGGSWDSTNVVDGDVAVVTPIAIDHERWLGHTIAEIARTKAGIIKDGATAVVAEQPEDAEREIVDAAAARGARLVREGLELEVVQRLVAVGGQLLDLRTPGGLYTEIFLPLHGEHQAHNALLALAAVEALVTGGAALPAGIVEAGFAGATSPGRLEVLRSSPTIIVDAAHNTAGAEALVGALDETFGLTRVVAVVAILADKDAEGILSVLEPHVDELVVTEVHSVRATPAEELGELAEDIFGEDRVHVLPDLASALDTAATLAESEDTVGVGAGAAVVVAGSVILAAEARILLGRP